MAKDQGKAFARMLKKKFGGVLTVEGHILATDTLVHEALAGMKGTENIVQLTGYLNKGPNSEVCTTSYVTGLSVHDGSLYALTNDKVYRLTGPWLFDVIKRSPFLSEIWKNISQQILSRASNA